MTWATRGTSEMPPIRDHTGRHRRKRSGLIGLLVAGGLLIVAISGALLSPLLTSGSASDQPAAAGLASATSADATPGPGTSAATSPATSLSPSPTGSHTTGPASTPPTTKKAPTTPRTTVAPDVVVTLEDDVFRLTNEAHKAACDGASLKLNAALRAAARTHSVDMARKNYFDHTGKDGSSPGDRMKKAGYNISKGWAENIAYGYANAEAVMTGWMNSPGHKANIQNCSLHSLGVGVARASNGRLYWTQDFGGA